MITIPTVLVLGAGASAPFRFPLGSQLRQNILGTVGALAQVGYSAADISRFCDAFLFSGKESVDAFLEHRTEFIEVGKAAIAQVLIPCESLPVMFRESNNNSLGFTANAVWIALLVALAGGFSLIGYHLANGPYEGWEAMQHHLRFPTIIAPNYPFRVVPLVALIVFGGFGAWLAETIFNRLFLRKK